MRRQLKRAFAGLTLLWFAVITVDPALLHACPVHNGTMSARVERPAVGHAAHDASGDARSSHGSGDGGSGQHRCACIGDCNTGTPVTGLAATPVAFLTAKAWLVLPGVQRDGSALVISPPFLLPFANGPPAGLRVA